jgi:hypothetical protein
MADAGEPELAQAQILLDPHGTSGRSAMKSVLLSLIAQGVLRLEQTQQKALVAGTKTSTWLRPGPTPAPSAPSYVAPIVDAVRAAQADEGTLKAVLKEIEKEFGVAYWGLKQNHILPALEARGLLKYSRKPFLLVLKKAAYDYSAAGEGAKKRLQEKLAEARRIPQLLAGAPANAAAVAVATGDLFILVDELIAHYQPLAAALRAQSGDKAFVAMADALDSLAGRSALDAHPMLSEDNSGSPGG